MAKLDKDKTIEQLKLALDSVPSYVYMKDVDSKYTYANKMTLNLFSVSEAELIGKSDSEFFDDETTQQLRQIDLKVFAGQSTNQEVITYDKQGNEKVYIEVKTPILESGKVIGLLGISTDISDQKELEKQITHLSLTDPLTNLPNRRHLNAHFAQLKVHPERHKYTAFLFIDLNDFKPINDKFGHDVGDKALKIVARRLQSDLRDVDYVARLGGDEFVALLEHVDDNKQSAEQLSLEIIKRIKTHLMRPIKISDVEVSLSASVGCVLFSGKENNIDNLLNEADHKMYKNKMSDK